MRLQGSELSEAPLLDLLEAPPPGAGKGDVIGALGATGTVAGLLRLYPYQLDPRWGLAARRAVFSISQRQGQRLDLQAILKVVEAAVIAAPPESRPAAPIESQPTDLR